MAQQASIDHIFTTLSTKSKLKQRIYKNTQRHFDVLRSILQKTANDLDSRLKTVAPDVDVAYSEVNHFESQLKFSGDILAFTMHTNVFAFPGDHVIYKNPYVAADRDRSYCGMIQIYNFLSDSFKYSRLNDVGYLIGRIFINHEDHFFVDGNKRLMFIFSDFGKQKMTEPIMCNLVEHAMKFAMDFDLFVPPFDMVREVAVGEKLLEQNVHGLRTGKRLGFDLSSTEMKEDEEFPTDSE